MTGTFAGILFYVVLALIIASAKRSKKDGGSAGRGMTGRAAGDTQQPGRTRQVFRTAPRGGARALDGHELKGERDITCRRFGHRHADDTEPRYLVHDDPMGEDYITLNGKRYRLKEADKYFCR